MLAAVCDTLAVRYRSLLLG